MLKKAVFAGGCFWCMVKPFDRYNGVISVTSGYTGGDLENPTYEQVCSGKTGHREAVCIVYNDELISYGKLLEIFWGAIDPTDDGGQFNDRGEHYKTAIYYFDEEQKKLAEESKQKLDESKLYSKPIVTKILPLKVFYQAEEYHQNYYKKNPEHYNRYYRGSGRFNFVKKNWAKQNLTPIQYEVTQNNMTEPPFQNEYYNHFEEGIYVDIVSGEALFSSKDKFESGCGWPSFSKGINKESLVGVRDLSHGMDRIEVKKEIHI